MCEVPNSMNSVEGPSEQDNSNSKFNDVLCPCRFGAVECGLEPHPEGSWMQRADIIKAIDFILDDDEKVNDRLQELFRSLRA